MRLDTRDKKLIQELLLDSRQSTRELGKKLHISKSAVNYRIKKLIKNKVMLGFRTYINYSKLNTSLFAVYLKFENITKETEFEIIKYLLTNKKVTWLGNSYGNWEIIFEFKTENQIELISFLSEFYKNFSQYIKKKELVQYISEDVFGFKFFKTNKLKPIHLDFLGKQEKLDKLDKKIIDYLEKKPDYLLHALALKLNVSLDTARKRIKKLIKNKTIAGFSAQINFDSLNWSWYIFQVSFNKYFQESEFLNFLKLHPNTYYAIKYLGKWDYEIGLYISDSKELEKFIFELKSKFPELIKDYEFSLITKLHKFNNYSSTTQNPAHNNLTLNNLPLNTL